MKNINSVCFHIWKHTRIISLKGHFFFTDPEADAETCVNSLKFDNLSAEEFDCVWQSCSQYRLQDIMNSSDQKSIFEKWPYYKKPNGYRLVSFFVCNIFKIKFSKYSDYSFSNILEQNVFLFSFFYFVPFFYYSLFPFLFFDFCYFFFFRLTKTSR